MCAKLSAGSGSEWSTNTFSPTWQQGGVLLGCRVGAAGQWQAAVAAPAAPPDILHQKFINPFHLLASAGSARVADVEAQLFLFIAHIRSGNRRSMNIEFRALAARLSLATQAVSEGYG